MCQSISLILTVMSFAQVGQVNAPTSAASTQNDCGVSALYVLLRMEGENASIADIQSALPPRPKLGYSLAELRGAARSLGVELIGVQLAPLAESIDRPAIVLFRGARGGHFAVVRPVGTSRKLLQVIDSGRTPEVGDAVNLFRSPAWTGTALVPRRRSSSPYRAVAIGVSLLSGALIIATGAITEKQRSREKQAPPIDSTTVNPLYPLTRSQQNRR